MNNPFLQTNESLQRDTLIDAMYFGQFERNIALFIENRLLFQEGGHLEFKEGAQMIGKGNESGKFMKDSMPVSGDYKAFENKQQMHALTAMLERKNFNIQDKENLLKLDKDNMTKKWDIFNTKKFKEIEKSVLEGYEQTVKTIEKQDKIKTTAIENAKKVFSRNISEVLKADGHLDKESKKDTNMGKKLKKVVTMLTKIKDISETSVSADNKYAAWTTYCASAPGNEYKNLIKEPGNEFSMLATYGTALELLYGGKWEKGTKGLEPAAGGAHVSMGESSVLYGEMSKALAAHLKKGNAEVERDKNPEISDYYKAQVAYNFNIQELAKKNGGKKFDVWQREYYEGNIKGQVEKATKEPASQEFIKNFFNRVEAGGKVIYVMKPKEDIIASAYAKIDIGTTGIVTNPLHRALKAYESTVGSEGKTLIGRIREYYGGGDTLTIDQEHDLVNAKSKISAFKEQYQKLVTGKDKTSIDNKLRFAGEQYLQIQKSLSEISSYGALDTTMQLWCVFVAQDKGIGYVQQLLHSGVLTTSGVSVVAGKFPKKEDFQRAELAFGIDLTSGQTMFGTGIDIPGGDPLLAGAATIDPKSNQLRKQDMFYRMQELASKGIEEKLEEGLGIPAKGAIWVKYKRMLKNKEIKGAGLWDLTTDKGRTEAKADLMKLFSSTDKGRENVQRFLEYIDKKEPSELHGYSISILKAYKALAEKREITMQKLADQRTDIAENQMSVEKMIKKPLGKLWKRLKKGDPAAILASVFVLKNLFFGSGPIASAAKGIVGGGALYLTLKKIAPELMHGLDLGGIKLGGRFDQKGSAMGVGMEKMSVLDVVLKADMGNINLNKISGRYQEISGNLDTESTFTRSDYMAFGGPYQFKDSREHYPEEKTLRKKIYQVFENELIHVCKYYDVPEGQRTPKKGLQLLQTRVKKDAEDKGLTYDSLTFSDLVILTTSEQEINETFKDDKSVTEAITTGFDAAWGKVKEVYDYVAPRVGTTASEFYAWAKYVGLPTTREAISKAMNWGGWALGQGVEVSKEYGGKVLSAMQKLASGTVTEIKEAALLLQALYNKTNERFRNGIIVDKIHITDLTSGNFSKNIERQPWSKAYRELATGHLKAYLEGQKPGARKVTLDKIKCANANDKEVFAVGSSHMKNFERRPTQYSTTGEMASREASEEAAIENLKVFVREGGDAAEKIRNQLKAIKADPEKSRNFSNAYKVNVDTMTDEQLYDTYVDKMAQKTEVFQIDESDKYVTFLWLPLPNSDYTQGKMANHKGIPPAAEMSRETLFQGDSVRTILTEMDKIYKKEGESKFFQVYRWMKGLVTTEASPSVMFRNAYNLEYDKDYEIFCKLIAKDESVHNRSEAWVKRMLFVPGKFDYILGNQLKEGKYTWVEQGKTAKDICWAFKNKEIWNKILPNFSKDVEPYKNLGDPYDKIEQSDSGGEYKNYFTAYLRTLGRDKFMGKVEKLLDLQKEYADYVVRAEGFKKGIDDFMRLGPPNITPAQRALIDNKIGAQVENALIDLVGQKEGSTEKKIKDWMDILSSAGRPKKSGEFIQFYNDTEPKIKGVRSEPLKRLLQLQYKICYLRQTGELHRGVVEKNIKKDLSQYISSMSSVFKLDASDKTSLGTVIRDDILSADTVPRMNSRVAYFKYLFMKHKGKPAEIKKGMESADKYAKENAISFFKEATSKEKFGGSESRMTTYRTMMQNLIQQKIDDMPAGATRKDEYKKYLYTVAAETSIRLYLFEPSSIGKSMDYSELEKDTTWDKSEIGAEEYKDENTLKAYMNHGNEMMSYEKWDLGKGID